MNAIDTAIVTDNTVTKTIYSDGLKGILASRLDSGDVDEAMKMFVTKQSEAMDALRESTDIFVQGLLLLYNCYCNKSKFGIF